MQIPCVYIPGPAPAVSVANSGELGLTNSILFFSNQPTDNVNMSFL